MKRDEWHNSWYMTGRFSKCERKVDARGEALHRMCTNNELLVLNGRAKSDRQGFETYTGPHGKSVLDYAIVHKEALADLQIEQLDFLSKSYHNALIIGLFDTQQEAPQEPAQPKSVRVAPIHLTD